MLKEDLLNDLKEAMKNKDVDAKNAIQMVRTAILQYEKDKQEEVSESQILAIVAKEVKTRKEALEEFTKAGRDDLIEKTNNEIKAIEKYLPKQLSDEELETKIKEIISRVGATTMKDMGNVMKEAKAEIGAQADGRRINEIVKNLLG